MSGTPHLIAGRYQPLDAVRHGVPQRARDLQTAQTVLLRTVRLPQHGTDEALAYARSARGIFHPSLVTLFDVTLQPDDHLLLAYEYAPAQTLAQVSGGAPLNPRRAAELLTELGDAVAELHARGIAHGGISQATVLVTMKGKAKLDRIGDPSLAILVEPSSERDVAALGDLLQELAGRPAAGMPGMEAIELAITRARAGSLTAATFAALLRPQQGSW